MNRTKIAINPYIKCVKLDRNS